MKTTKPPQIGDRVRHPRFPHEGVILKEIGGDLDLVLVEFKHGITQDGRAIITLGEYPRGEFTLAEARNEKKTQESDN